MIFKRIDMKHKLRFERHLYIKRYRFRLYLKYNLQTIYELFIKNFF